MKKTILTIVMAALWLIPKAQTLTAKPLNIGDQLPESLWHSSLTVINGNGEIEQTNLKAHQGKLIILDFWATWCSSCIAGFPKLEKLHAEFPDQLKILLVTDEPASKVSPLLQTRKARNQELRLPSVLSDTLLHQFFPHHLIPHYIWISPAGKVINITASDAITTENISALLQGQHIQTSQKQDLDISKPLFSAPSLPEQNLEYFSLLLKGYYPGLGSGTSYRYQKDSLTGIALTNSSLRYLYQMTARGLLPNYPEKRMLFDHPASQELAERPKGEPWKSDQLYSYELRLPASQSKKLYPQLLEQLNQLSPYRGILTRKRIHCLVLRKTHTQIPESQGGERLNQLDESNQLTMRNAQMLALSGRLNNAFKVLILDETGIAYPMDLNLTLHENDLEGTNKELAKYGLTLKPAMRKTQVLLLQADPNK